jgi:hypothetical protein
MSAYRVISRHGKRKAASVLHGFGSLRFDHGMSKSVVLSDRAAARTNAKNLRDDFARAWNTSRADSLIDAF